MFSQQRRSHEKEPAANGHAIAGLVARQEGQAGGGAIDLRRKRPVREEHQGVQGEGAGQE